MNADCNTCKYCDRPPYESPCCECYLVIDEHGEYMSKHERPFDKSEQGGIMKGLVEEGTEINCKECIHGKTCNVANAHCFRVKECKFFKQIKKMTNADKIRSMTDEELKEFLCSYEHDCGYCRFGGSWGCAIEAWLKREVDE